MTDIERQVVNLLETYAPFILSVVHRYVTSDVNDANDAYQEICLNVWKYVPRSFDPDKGILFLYFKRRVFQEAYNYKHRRLLNRKEIYGEVPDVVSYSEDSVLLSDLYGVADTYRRKRIIDLVIEGYTVKEMAEELKMAKKTILKELNYFREVLQRDYLGE